MSRRALMLAALAVLAVPTAGCRVRLESDAPEFLPEPSPDPAGPAILAERDRVARLVTACERIAGPVVSQWRPVHASQLAALDAALATLDPPLSPAPSPRTSAPASTMDLGDLADLEFADLDEPGLVALDGLVPRAAGLVVASYTQRAVALDVLRAAGAPGGAVLPALPWRAASDELATHLVGAIRSAAYGLEVAAAQSDTAHRAPMLEGLRSLRQAEAVLGSGVPDLPPRPLGYPLPGPVTTPAQAARLAIAVLDRLVAVTLGAAAPTATALQEDAGDTEDEQAVPAPADDAAAETDAHPTAVPHPIAPSAGRDLGAAGSLVRLAAVAETTRLRCGAPVRPLPGLRPSPPSTPTVSPSAGAGRPSPSTPSPVAPRPTRPSASPPGR